MTQSMRHKWDYDGERRIAAADSQSGCDQNEKPCIACRIVKITIIQPDGQFVRAWRHPNSPVQFACEHTPPCLQPSAPVPILAHTKSTP